MRFFFQDYGDYIRSLACPSITLELSPSSDNISCHCRGCYFILKNQLHCFTCYSHQPSCLKLRCYLIIYLTARRNQRQIQHQHQHKRQASNENIVRVTRFKKSAFNTRVYFTSLLLPALQCRYSIRWDIPNSCFHNNHTSVP